MILKAQILFNDQLAEKEFREEELIWQDAFTDLREIAGICPYQQNNEALLEYTEITFKSGSARVINVPFKKVQELMLQVWGNVVVVEYISEHESNINNLLSGLGNR